MANINKYKFIRFIMIFTGIFLSPVSWLIPKNKKRIIFCSTSNLRYNYNSKYLFEYFKNNYPVYEVKYILNNKELKERLEKEMGNYFIDTFSIKNIIYCLKAHTWITSSLETPLGGIFLRWNRLVIHLGHGTPFKNIGFLEKNIDIVKKIYYILIKNNFSYFLSTSHNFDEIMSKFLNVPLKRIFTNGQPRNDSLFINKKEFLQKNFVIKKADINILYAPTWRQKTETVLFPFADIDYKKLEKYLQENNINIFLRIHPSFESEIDEEILKIKGIYVFNSKLAEDVTEYLSCFDILITDYSSIFIDYLLLNRPILFFPYDLEVYKKEIGFTVDFEEHTPGPKIYDFDAFLKEILKYQKDNKYYKEKLEKENEFYNICRNNTNCKDVTKFILSKIKEQ